MQLRMACLALFLAITSVLVSAQQGSTTNPEIAPGFAVPAMEQVAPDVYVKEIAPSLWVYTEVGKLDDGSPYPANGTLLVKGDHSVLVDTGWTSGQAETLYSFAKDTLHKPITKAIVTHWHADRAGGVDVMRAHGVDVLALELTGEELAKRKRPVPNKLLKRAQFPYRDADGVELFYPGEGHSADNIVVYFPEQKVLDGGCFLKSSNSTGLGNLSDANLKEWPKSLEKLAKRYPQAKIVIPGHGPAEGDAIGVTRKLLAAKAAQ